jgi:hypothetical protein
MPCRPKSLKVPRRMTPAWMIVARKDASLDDVVAVAAPASAEASLHARDEAAARFED